jgi:hypothetical protein
MPAFHSHILGWLISRQLVNTIPTNWFYSLSLLLFPPVQSFFALPSTASNVASLLPDEQRAIKHMCKHYPVPLQVTPGSHSSELAVNKQLADKERVAAALENPNLVDMVNRCVDCSGWKLLFEISMVSYYSNEAVAKLSWFNCFPVYLQLHFVAHLSHVFIWSASLLIVHYKADMQGPQP